MFKVIDICRGVIDEELVKIAVRREIESKIMKLAKPSLYEKTLDNTSKNKKLPKAPGDGLGNVGAQKGTDTIKKMVDKLTKK